MNRQRGGAVPNAAREGFAAGACRQKMMLRTCCPQPFPPSQSLRTSYLRTGVCVGCCFLLGARPEAGAVPNAARERVAAGAQTAFSPMHSAPSLGSSPLASAIRTARLCPDTPYSAPLSLAPKPPTSHPSLNPHQPNAPPSPPRPSPPCAQVEATRPCLSATRISPSETCSFPRPLPPLRAGEARPALPCIPLPLSPLPLHPSPLTPLTPLPPLRAGQSRRNESRAGRENGEYQHAYMISP
jgi:hypothetical protein